MSTALNGHGPISEGTAPVPPATPRRVRAVDPAIKSEAIRLLRSTTLAQSAIAHRLGVSRGSVSQWGREAGVVRPPGAPRLPAFMRGPAESGPGEPPGTTRSATARPMGAEPLGPRAPRAPANRRPPAETRHTRLVARLYRAFERQVAEIEARFADPGLRTEEKDARTLGTLARTLETLMTLERDESATAKPAEPPDRAGLNSELVRRLRRWAEGGEGPGDGA